MRKERFLEGCNGNCGALWRVETRVTPSVSFSIPARRRAFCPNGSPSCALFGRREAAVRSMLSEAVRSTRRRFLRASHLLGLALGSALGRLRESGATAARLFERTEES